MEQAQGVNRSFWRKYATGVSYPKLTENITVDTTVVGGGMSGILAAYHLAKAGKKVALLEAREFVSGTTGGTTAKLTSQHELVYARLLQGASVEIAKLYYEANQEGLKLIESLVDELNIDCEFEKMDAYVYSQNGIRTAELEREALAYETIGINGSMTDATPLHFNVDSALMMEDQAQFHPIKFLHGVLQQLDFMGVKIYQHTMYMESTRENSELTLKTDTPFTVTCDEVIFATLFPAEDPDSYYSKTMKPVTSHLAVYENTNTPLHGMYISDDFSKRTFRGAQQDHKHFLIVGGETHETGDDKSNIKRYDKIKQFAENEFGLQDRIGYWSEHDLVTPDMRPFIGKIKENDDQMYVMTGYNKWGLAAAATGSQLIADMITGKPNRYENLFCPQRDVKQIRQKEEDNQNGEFAAQQSAELDVGQAKRTEVDGKAVGIYKDINKKTHYVDLACTHLGCEVKWNDADETWDCPCHGSIFDGTGEVLAGPAKLPLKKVNPY